MNIVFAAIVCGLALTAVTAYINAPQAHVRAPDAVTAPVPGNTAPLDLSERIAALQQMSAGDPQNAGYPAQIGNLYYDAGQYEKAAEYYEKSLNIEPRNANVETDLATCYHYMGQHDRSLQVLENVLAYNPGFTQAKFNKGIVLIEGKKEVQAGISVWEDLLRTTPGYEHRRELEERIYRLKVPAQ